ncbi:MAG: Magnesium transporter MgtE [Peptostreptococcus russellii]|uniref:Magnesium transporter MgtE n=1 Tax=Peptostreptococcus russellii TaxID=215200 RepID=A0A2P7Q1U4_9FIRM|nr:magnesium transporter [Peptostreptococcus russellii]PSJ31941.1 divalent cation transporter [Peptostreptococcus russellii]
MDKKQDSSRELYDVVKEMMNENKLIELREMLEEYHTMDLYDILLELEDSDQVKLFELLPLDTAASVLEESEAEFFINIISRMDQEHIRSIFDEMSLGDLSDVLRDLDEKQREKILNVVSKEDEIELRELLAYLDDTSGSTMKKGFITVNKNLNVTEAIRHIRMEATEADSIYYIYVIDNEHKLVGVLSLRDLFIAKESEIIEDIMVENVKSVRDNEDREEAVKVVSKYNLVAVPVVDNEGILKGIITVDDVLDVMEEEATEDMYKFAGSSEHERDVAENEKSTLYQQVLSCVRGRIAWLILTVFLSLIAVYVFMKFRPLMDTGLIELLFFTPLVIAMGGNVGSQSSAVTIISLTNKDKDVDSDTILKEIISSIINGVVVSIIVAVIMMVFIGSINIIAVVVLATLINMILGATLGTLLPIVLQKMELDPSVISSPIVAVIMDIIGILVYFALISVFV